MPLSSRATHKKDLRDKPVKMTHQHFREIARIIRETAVWARPDERMAFVQHFAHRLAGTNPNFNRTRFLAACEPTP